jgi:hypothetical protein
MGVRGDAHRVLVGRPKGEKDHLEDAGVDGGNIKMGLQDVG